MNREHWAVWEGPEVEGRLFGMRTLFIGALPAGDPRLPERLINMGKHKHVYFLHEFVGAHGFDLVHHAVTRGLSVTLALTPSLLAVAPNWLLPVCHIQLVVSVPEIAASALKPTDSIRLDIGDYHVLAATVHSFLETRPADYQVDSLIASR